MNQRTRDPRRQSTVFLLATIPGIAYSLLFWPLFWIINSGRFGVWPDPALPWAFVVDDLYVAFALNTATVYLIGVLSILTYRKFRS